MARIAFALPGDIATKTGGYIYDRRLVEGLRALGHEVEVIRLHDGFPAPTEAGMAEAAAALAAVPSDTVLIVDGLAFGALSQTAVAGIRAPLLALVHHPLALETGIDPATAARLKTDEKRNLAAAHAIVVTSPHTRDILIADYAVPPGAVAIALPGTDRPMALPMPTDPPVILSVGSLVARKGHDVLLAALAQVTDLPWRAVIAGAARDEAVARALSAQTEELDLRRRVTFMGELDDFALGALFRQATVFALATRYEGYGMVFAEALAHGLPIVTCRAGAVPGTVPQAAGLLVPPDMPDAFAGALRRVLSDDGFRAGLAAGSARAGRALPTWDDTAHIVAQVVTDIAR